jgi:type I restriction enzyme S subunit
MSGWPSGKLGDSQVCILNPKKREVAKVPDDTLISFVPMVQVDDVSGVMDASNERPLGEVRKGYTYFAEGDVVFAKITPCMENGKSAIALNLRNGIGFGTTEFHVLRPGPLATAEWIHLFVRNSAFREEAKKNMHGAAGQQRVPVDFLRETEIPIPPLDEQCRIAARIEELTCPAVEVRKLQSQSTNSFESLLPSYLQRLTKKCVQTGWHFDRLGEKDIARIIMGQSPPGNSYNREERGIPLLNGPTEFGESHPSPVQWTTDSKRECMKGDILFCVRGSTTGRMNWADQTYSIGRGIAAIRATRKKMLPDFVYGMIHIQVNDILHKAEGGVFPNFNKGQLASLPIPVPPFSEQETFVHEMKALNNLQHEAASLQKEVDVELAQFQSALLAKAFRGEL